jgi:hypothetical protein
MEDYEKKKIKQKNTENNYHKKTQDLYKFIKNSGEESFLEGGRFFRFKETPLLEKLILYFESTEEYEKCSVLLNIKKKISDKK